MLNYCSIWWFYCKVVGYPLLLLVTISLYLCLSLWLCLPLLLSLSPSLPPSFSLSLSLAEPFLFHLMFNMTILITTWPDQPVNTCTCKIWCCDLIEKIMPHNNNQNTEVKWFKNHSSTVNYYAIPNGTCKGSCYQLECVGFISTWFKLFDTIISFSWPLEPAG